MTHTRPQIIFVNYCKKYHNKMDLKSIDSESISSSELFSPRNTYSSDSESGFDHVGHIGSVIGDAFRYIRQLFDPNELIQERNNLEHIRTNLKAELDTVLVGYIELLNSVRNDQLSGTEMESISIRFHHIRSRRIVLSNLVDVYTDRIDGLNLRLVTLLGIDNETGW